MRLSYVVVLAVLGDNVDELGCLTFHVLMRALGERCVLEVDAGDTCLIVAGIVNVRRNAITVYFGRRPPGVLALYFVVPRCGAVGVVQSVVESIHVHTEHSIRSCGRVFKSVGSRYATKL